MMKDVIRYGVICCSMLLVAASARGGVISNGSFETGDFSNWSSIGSTAVVDNTFGSSPTAGNYQALMTTGVQSVAIPALENQLDLPLGTVNGLGTGNATQGSVIWQTISGQAGDTLSFDWNFLTDEFTPQPSFNDFAFWSLANVQDGAVLADTFFSSFNPSGSTFSQETGFFSTSYVLPTSGTFTLGFGVVDVNDFAVTSGLLIDNVSVNPVVPEPGSLLIFSLGACAGGLGLRRRRGAGIRSAAATA